MEVPLAIFFLHDCKAAVVWTTGLGNFNNIFSPNLEIELGKHSVPYVILKRTYVTAVIGALAPSSPDVVVAHKSVGRAHLDQAQVRQAQPGSYNLGHLGVDALSHLNAAMGDVDSGILLIDGHLKLQNIHDYSKVNILIPPANHIASYIFRPNI